MRGAERSKLRAGERGEKSKSFRPTIFLVDFVAIQRVLDAILRAGRFAATDDLNGTFLPSARPEAEIRRFGLALTPGPGWAAWVEEEKFDAVFLHRPWNMDNASRRALAAGGVGVLAYHLSFDERLTTGFNPTLAAACGWGEPMLLGEKEGRPLGMTCALPGGPLSFAEVAARLEAEFGGLEEITPPAAGPDAPLGSVACVGAMNDRLVRAAGEAGVGIYITGQWRQPARRAVRETGLGVAAVGHGRSEEWGLRALARLMRTDPKMGGLEIVVADG